MTSIQIPDTVAVQVDMHEVQIHVKWDEYDIAMPLPVLRMINEATTYLVEQVGGPPTEEQRRALRGNP